MLTKDILEWGGQGDRLKRYESIRSSSTHRARLTPARWDEVEQLKLGRLINKAHDGEEKVLPVVELKEALLAVGVGVEVERALAHVADAYSAQYHRKSE